MLLQYDSATSAAGRIAPFCAMCPDAWKEATMPRPINTALSGLAPSAIRRISARAAARPGCISLALGEPEFDTHEPIRAEVPRALDRGETHYAPNAGTPSLRRAISGYMAEQGLSFAPDEIVVTLGASEAISSTLLALLNPGDEVIIPVPAFVSYESVTTMLHATPVFLDTAPSAFQIAEDELRALVTPATKAIVINSPNNPTGCLLDAASLDAVARVAGEFGLYVVSDDVYNRLVYGDGCERFAARHPELRVQTVVIDSFSKPWAMTGWRIGWLACAEPLRSQILKAHQFAVSSNTAFCLSAAEVALGQDPSAMLETYRRRRTRVVEALHEMGLPVHEPQGAFYAFPSIAATGLGDEEFCERAIDEAGVGLVPGSCFGAPGFVRLSFCISDADVDEALRRLSRFVSTV